jgi:hypothetical protein
MNRITFQLYCPDYHTRIIDEKILIQLVFPNKLILHLAIFR